MKGLELLNPKFKSEIDGEKIAQELVSKLSERVSILEAYLFGSAAEGRMTRDSDIDLLLVIADEASETDVYAEVNKPFFSPIAVDWIILDKSNFDRKKNYGGVAFIAYHQGKKMEIKK